MGSCVGRFVFKDEAWFHLSGYINIQNSRIWSAENPDVLLENNSHLSKISVCCVLSPKQIMGPLFCEETITAENCPNNFAQFIALLEENKRD
jgi:hypothetical protein